MENGAREKVLSRECFRVSVAVRVLLDGGLFFVGVLTYVVVPTATCILFTHELSFTNN